MIRLRMNIGGNLLQVDHHAVSPHECPEVFGVRIASALMRNFKTQLRAVKVETGVKILDNKEGSDTVQRRHGLMVARQSGASMP
jgi:hypothetical protein